MSVAEPTTNIDFVGKRHLTLILSILIFIFCAYEWISSGNQKFGIDFVGGNELVIGFQDAIDIAKVRDALTEKGLSSASVQSFEKGSNQFSIRVKGSDVSDVNVTVQEALTLTQVPFEVLRNDYVGPLIGDKIKQDAIKSIVFALLILLIYITWKFEFGFAVGAVVALLHDVLMSVGVFIYLGGEIDASALAALLTVIGYSVNDTIVLFDRVRENMFLKLRGKADAKIGNLSLKSMEMPEIINLSVNQTLSRTILTSLTTLFTCFALWYYGGGAISDIALILIIGIVTGTYSTIYVASTVALFLHKKK